MVRGFVVLLLTIKYKINNNNENQNHSKSFCVGKAWREVFFQFANLVFFENVKFDTSVINTI